MNKIILTQNVDTKSQGCCCNGLTDVIMSSIKELKNDIDFLMEINGINTSTGKV